MFRLFSVVAIVLLSSNFAGSAGPDSTGAPENSLVAGAYALQFGIVSFGRLTSLDGATLALKRQSSESAAWRFSFSANASIKDATNSG